MTLPDERTRAVLYARQFLRDLLDPKATPRVPRAVRERARRLLKHFPSSFDLRQSAKELPRVWSEPEDPAF